MSEDDIDRVIMEQNAEATKRDKKPREDNSKTNCREFWIKGDYVYPSEPANVGKTLHVIEYSAYEALERSNYDIRCKEQSYKNTIEQLEYDKENLNKEIARLEADVKFWKDEVGCKIDSIKALEGQIFNLSAERDAERKMTAQVEIQKRALKEERDELKEQLSHRLSVYENVFKDREQLKDKNSLLSGQVENLSVELEREKQETVRLLQHAESKRREISTYLGDAQEELNQAWSKYHVSVAHAAEIKEENEELHNFISKLTRHADRLAAAFTEIKDSNVCYRRIHCPHCISTQALAEHEKFKS